MLANDEAVFNLLYLTLKNIEKKWTMPIREWKRALQQFAILLEGRMSSLLPKAYQLGELVKNEPPASLYFLIRIENDCAVSLTSQTCRQKKTQFSAEWISAW